MQSGWRLHLPPEHTGKPITLLAYDWTSNKFYRSQDRNDSRNSSSPNEPVVRGRIAESVFPFRDWTDLPRSVTSGPDSP